MPAAEATRTVYDLVSMYQAAAALGLTRYSLLRKAAEGAIAPVQVAGRLMFHAADVERMAAERAEGAGG
jgi:hypothetical protein